MIKKLTMFLVIFSMTVFSQLKIIKIEQLEIGGNETWSYPTFSKDGKSIFLTNENYNGIWKYSLRSKNLEEITKDAGSGYCFDVSEDNSTIVYRKTTLKENNFERTQVIIKKDLNNGNVELLESGNNLSIPKIQQNSIIFNNENKIKTVGKQLTSLNTMILGIEDTKIVLLKNGKKVIFDPLKNGSYVWPSLSPDGSKILAYDMERGVFIFDLDGNIISKLGRIDAPGWSNNGEWIIYYKEKNDGQNIVGSDLFAISVKTNQEYKLTDTKDIIEMNPNCSPTENKFVFNTIDGKILVFTYEESGK